jgi:hypothetical protein
MSWQNILKSYNLDEFIITKDDKRKPIKEKAAKETEVQLAPGISGVIVITSEMDKIIKEIEDWYRTCNSMTLGDIGIKGEKKSTLLDHVLFHWDESVKRPEQEEKQGAKESIKNVMKIIREEEGFTKQDLKNVENYIKDLKAIEEYSRSNPKNILFTEQITPEKKRVVRGHYRTKWYADKTGEEAVPSEWYDYEAGPGKFNNASKAKPPFWQALFAGGNNPAGGEVTKGILQLLIELEEEIPKQPITDIRVYGKAGREAISKLRDFMTVFRNILSTQDNYHSESEPFKRLWLNNTKVRRVLAQTPFQIPKGKLKQEKFKKIFGLEKYATENLKDWRVVKITAGLIRSIILNSRISTMNHKHGAYKGIFLNTPSRTATRQDQKQLWDREYAKSKREKNLPRWAYSDEDKAKENVQKSWSDILKVMPSPQIRPMENPAAGLHMPKIFSKERQATISSMKKETCDYCERDVVLDCKACNQKLCDRHLNKPCVVKKASKIKTDHKLDRKFGGQTPHGTKAAGGEVTINDLRMAVKDAQEGKPPEDDFGEDAEGKYLLMVLPNSEGELTAGLFTWNKAKELYGEPRLKQLLVFSDGFMGANWVDSAKGAAQTLGNLTLDEGMKVVNQ